MTDDRSLERAARSWLENGPTEAPDRAVEAALLRIQTLPQERDLRIPWRFPTMTTPARIAAAAVIGVLVVGGALFMLGRPGQPAVGGPGPSPTPTRSPTPIPSTDGSTGAPRRPADPGYLQRRSIPAGSASRSTVPDDWAGRTVPIAVAPRCQQFGSRRRGTDLREGWLRLSSDPCGRAMGHPGRTERRRLRECARGAPASSRRRRRSPSLSTGTLGSTSSFQPLRTSRLRRVILPMGTQHVRPGPRANAGTLDPRCRWHPRRGPDHRLCQGRRREHRAELQAIVDSIQIEP